MSKIHATKSASGIVEATKRLREGNAKLEASHQIAALCDPMQTAREQILICRNEITLGIARLKADEHLSPGCALMCAAVLEHFGAQIALEAAEAEGQS